MARMAPLPDFDAEQLDRLDAVNHQRIINAARKLEQWSNLQNVKALDDSIKACTACALVTGGCFF